MGIEAVNPFELPLLNTVILLSSGITVTYAHHSLIQGNRSGALYGLLSTVLLAVVFTGFQGVEYTVSCFTISDGAFGSCFYFATGFHGLHVMIGSNKNFDWLCDSSIGGNACYMFMSFILVGKQSNLFLYLVKRYPRTQFVSPRGRGQAEASLAILPFACVAYAGSLPSAKRFFTTSIVLSHRQVVGRKSAKF